MWTYLSILHSDSERRLPLELSDHFLWQTCMRNVYVSDTRLFAYDPLKLQTPDYCAYQGYEAYSFLLEMVLGLHSALLGESEVFHQFREAFLRKRVSPVVLDPYLKKLCIDITQDMRVIRSQYMYGWGELSYGGVARRLLREKAPWQILLLGSGQLASQLIPWLLKDKHSIQVAGRNFKRLKEIKAKFPVRTAHYKELSKESLASHSAVLIAAPLILRPYLALFKKGMRILDFRGDVSEELNILPGLSYYSLKDITAFISQSRAKREQLFWRLRPQLKKRIALRKSKACQSAHSWEELSSRCVL